jgi:hypothetical protein
MGQRSTLLCASRVRCARQWVQAGVPGAISSEPYRLGDVWPLYLEQGRPKRKDAWKPRYLADLNAMALPGGEKKKRGQGTTRPGRCSR